LEEAGGGDSLGDDAGGLAGAGAQLTEADGGDFDVEVDAVEERAGDAAAVALDEGRRAEAGVPWIS
jgi:hypothetical protein